MCVGRPVFAHGFRHHLEHVDFALGVIGAKPENVTTGVVENAVNAYRLTLAVDDDSGRVTHAGMPKGPWALGLPSQTHFAPRAVTATQRHAIQALLLVEAPDTARRDSSFGKPALGCQRA